MTVVFKVSYELECRFFGPSGWQVILLFLLNLLQPRFLRRAGRSYLGLLLSGISDNVGGVKRFLSVLLRALRRARHFALVEDVPIQPRLARNQYSGQELSPTHASLRSQRRS